MIEAHEATWFGQKKQGDARAGRMHVVVPVVAMLVGDVVVVVNE